MRRERERKRLESDPPDYPANLPVLRREIIIIDHDFGTIIEHMKLYKSDRIDCYCVEIDGKTFHERLGWAKCLELVRKSFLRISAAVS